MLLGVGQVKNVKSRLVTKPTNDCAPSEDSDQPGHPPSLIEDSDQPGHPSSLIKVFAVRLMGS